ncbi:MAG TPA: hydrogenase maturation protease [Clostridia bacterium]|nr:hydrogenase maturation protease [Clostridia bacterium]
MCSKDNGVQKILVLGVGNVLLQDEGFGVHLVREMAAMEWPPQVEFIDGGTAGLELIHLLEGASLLIVVDSLDAQVEPGSVFKFQVGDVADLPKKVKTSFHDIGLLEVLQVAGILGCLPETIIFGVQPKTVDWGLELTPELDEVKSKVISLIAEEISARTR